MFVNSFCTLCFVAQLDDGTSGFFRVTSQVGNNMFVVTMPLEEEFSKEISSLIKTYNLNFNLTSIPVAKIQNMPYPAVDKN